ncbi:MAG: PLD nuclease N-terminal domain-containing protein [Ruaniaceae bacterium]|nr:PLD nuclease N-terminal domain-containing protein [Ruaniaceae bacterium]
MARILPIVLLLALIIFALVDCIRTPKYEMPPGLPRGAWIALIILVPVVGAAAWLLVSRFRGIAPGGALRRPKGPTAPDDDPQFLADLDWQARKAHHERMKAEKERKAAEESDAGDS